jgi:hypothetical protein
MGYLRTKVRKEDWETHGFLYRVMWRISEKA